MFEAMILLIFDLRILDQLQILLVLLLMTGEQSPIQVFALLNSMQLALSRRAISFKFPSELITDNDLNRPLR